MHAKGLGENMPGMLRKHRPGRAGQEARPHETEHDDSCRGNTQRGRDNFILPHGGDGASDPRLHQVDGELDQRDGDSEKEVKFYIVQGQLQAKHRLARHRHAVGAAGHGRQMQIKPAHKFAEGQGNDREIVEPYPPERGPGGEKARRRAQDRGQWHGKKPGHAKGLRQDRRAIGPDTEKCDIGEGKLTQIADHDVEPQGRHGIDQHAVDHELHIGIGDQRQAKQDQDQPPAKPGPKTRPRARRHAAKP